MIQHLSTKLLEVRKESAFAQNGSGHQKPIDFSESRMVKVGVPGIPKFEIPEIAKFVPEILEI
jgi:hypothetical protein